MKLVFAFALLATAAFVLVGAFVRVGIDAGAAVRYCGLPLVLASASGALLWSWTERRRP